MLSLRPYDAPRVIAEIRCAPFPGQAMLCFPFMAHHRQDVFLISNDETGARIDQVLRDGVPE